MDFNIVLDKIRQGRKYCQELKDFMPKTLEEFNNNIMIQRVGERYFEITVQVILDICTHITSRLPVNTPSTYSACMDALADQGILTDEIRITQVKLVKMRNIIAHQYTTIDYELLYHALKRLCVDFEIYVEAIQNWIENQ